MKQIMHRESTADTSHSLGLKALAALPISHYCLEERDEAFGVLAGLHGADLMLKGANGLSGNEEPVRESVT